MSRGSIRMVIAHPAKRKHNLTRWPCSCHRPARRNPGGAPSLMTAVRYIFPPEPSVLDVPGQCWGSIDGWAGDTYELTGAHEACACQCCAAHYWTCCGECGRDGDRAGDTNSPNACA